MTRGIYAINNKVNGKMYIGKSSNIERRWATHRSYLNRSEMVKKQTNRHLFNAWKSHGADSFEFIILAELPDESEDTIREMELFFMDIFNTYHRDYGYNLRRDSSTSMIVHEETRKLISDAVKGEKNPNFGNKWTDEQKKAMSEIQKQRNIDFDFFPQERRDAISKCSTELWKDKEKLAAMSKKVAEATSKLRFLMYDKKTGELVRTWESMLEIMEENPDYHRISIYSCCNGWKKSYRGYSWKSELKE